MAQEDNENVEQYYIEHVNDPLVDKFISQMCTFADGYIRVMPYRQFLPRVMEKSLHQIPNCKVSEDDVWIASFPKCGITWTEEMVWCLRNKLDFSVSRSIKLDHRVPWFESSAQSPNMKPNSFEIVNNLPSPKTVKTHLCFEMLPKKCREMVPKIIHVTRNPRDVCVSFYHMFKIFHAYTGTLENFCELFLNDMCGYYTPFIGHVLSYWNQRHHPKLLILTYEEMKADLPAIIRRVANFLEITVSNEEVSVLKDHLSFESMKKNSSVNKSELIKYMNDTFKTNFEQVMGNKEFIRKGQVGSWKEELTDDMIEKFKIWEDEGLRDSDLRFNYE